MVQEISQRDESLSILQEQVVQDLNRMMHDFAAVARQLSERSESLPMAANVIRLPHTETTYVMQYRDDEGCSRFAVVRSVLDESPETLTVRTSQGTLVVSKARIQDWVPVMDRKDEPYPAGWWLAAGVTA